MFGTTSREKVKTRSRRVLYAAGLAAALAGCSGFDPGEPDVRDSVVAEVLVDLQILEARERLGYSVSPTLRDSVLNLHGMDEQQLQQALDYYADHPNQFVGLYAIVLRRLDAEQYGELPDDALADTSFGAGAAGEPFKVIRGLQPQAPSDAPEEERPAVPEDGRPR